MLKHGSYGSSIVASIQAGSVRFVIFFYEGKVTVSGRLFFPVKLMMATRRLRLVVALHESIHCFQEDFFMWTTSFVGIKRKTVTLYLLVYTYQIVFHGITSPACWRPSMPGNMDPVCIVDDFGILAAGSRLYRKGFIGFHPHVYLWSARSL